MIEKNKHHILNGDSLNGSFFKDLNVIICRECLIDGPTDANPLELFWQQRAQFISKSFDIGESEYFNKTVPEFQKMFDLQPGSEVYLWFEDDLFCQVNLWFMLSLLNDKNLSLYRVFPPISEQWRGFSQLSEVGLEEAFNKAIKFKQSDVDLGVKLWDSYRKNEFHQLKAISNTSSDCFRFLPEVCSAHIERFSDDENLSRPEKVLTELMHSYQNFEQIFAEFNKTERIYGFGDSQIRLIYNQLLKRS